jgi:hypothetical protein
VKKPQQEVTMRASRPVILILALVLALPSLVQAQTTGSIVGHVSDASGGVLPGATVEARSPSLQGVRTVTTDTSGVYRLALLPPGTYAVSFNLASFTSRTIENVRVGLDRDTTLDAALTLASLKEAVTVTSEAPVVDTTTTTLGQNLDQRAIQTLPTGRNYSSVVQVTPGVSSDANPDNRQQSTISVYGSSGAENTFLIDGVNTTNVEYGFQGKDLNFEFIQEINVKAGGYEAEFGKATGGIINVITKSGSNAFHGDLFGYLDADSLQREADPVVSTGGTVTGFTRKDFGIDLGGPILKDRLWFFGAYDRVTNTTDSALPSGPLEGDPVEARTTRNLASAKLTLKLAENQTAVATFFQDPRHDTGVINDASHTLNGDPTTYQGRQDFGGRDYALGYDANFSRSWIFSAQVARHEEENSVGPETDAGDVIQYRDSRSDFFQTGGFGLIQQKTFRRNLGRASVTRFAGGHQIKLGAEWEQEKAQVVKRMSGGQQVDVFPNPEGGPQIYRHFYWTTPDAVVGNAPVSQLTANPEHRNTAVFLQDRWAVSNRLALNFGVRWDRQQIIDAAGTSQIDLKKDFAPRLGFVLDPKGDHRMKVFGSYGRYYEQIPMDLVIRSFSFERQPRIVNFDAVNTQPNLTAEAQFGTDSAILGGFTEPSDPDIKNQFLHEFIAGFEKEIAPDVAIGVKGVYRKYGRVIEDFLCMDDGTYCIGNPSTGLMERVFHPRLLTDLPRAQAAARLQGPAGGRHQALLAPLAGSRVLRPLQAGWELRRGVRALHERGSGSEHLGGLRLLRLLHERPRPRSHHEHGAALQRPPSSVQALGRLRSAVRPLPRSGHLLPHGDAAHALRLLRRLQPLRVLPHRARGRRPAALDLRGGRPRRVSGAAREAGEAQHPARRLQPSSTRSARCCSTSATPSRGGQLPARALQSGLRTGGAAHTTDVGPAGVAS